ncbi:cell division protein FtsZ [Methanomassiliicoccus luminyensis]|uniref:cell division protein FtsZ n=2 Tax=Methanomassiliicoccus luminyensis TaxID=1080712 RepID=UPI00191EEFDF|nr:cell division protein FtsZ [Methanomassiliicoccus luminyensis]
MPNSLVKNALGSEYQQKVNATPASEPMPHEQILSDTDRELLELAKQLDVCIKIIGCGGGGSNTINRCVDAGISGAQLCAINTDAKHLLTIRAPKKILIGRSTTRGMGAGALPENGEAAARENDADIRTFLQGSNIVFVTAGMGGGTGTGSAHYVASIAKEQIRALTVGVVTFPFRAEGTVRAENAMIGLNKLRSVCDTTIVVPNDKLLELVPKLPVDAAFKVADEVLMQTIKGLTEIITKPGLVNLDYADIQTVMKEGGVAFVGIGEATDDEDDRVKAAVHEALSSPLLGEINLKDAKGVLIRVVGGPDMTVGEAQRAAQIANDSVNERARIIWGCSIDPEIEGTIKILLIVTGASSKYMYGKGGAPTSRLGVLEDDIPKPKLGGQQKAQSQQRQAAPAYDDDGIDFVR